VSTYPVDYSIQPVSNPTSWVGGYQHNGVVDYCTGYLTASPCGARTAGVLGTVAYADVIVGTVACLTGSGDNDPKNGYHSSGAKPGTRCGEITEENGGISTNICSRKGDSGGPLFTELDGRAYGILNDGTDGSGACPTGPPGTEWSQFSPIDKILTHVGAQTVAVLGKDYGFRLRTTP
jgi:streptogrisin C